MSVQLGHALKEQGRLELARRAYREAEHGLGRTADLQLALARLDALFGRHRDAAERLAEMVLETGDGACADELFSPGLVAHSKAALDRAGAGSGVRFAGRVEHVAFGEARGWTLAEAADLELGRGDGKVLRRTANTPRPDLEAHGWGAVGFQIDLDDADGPPEAPVDLRSAIGPLVGSPVLATPPADVLAWLGRPVPSRGEATGSRPTISIVVPVHDPEPAWLDDLVASVLAQSFGDWELILIDDRSRRPDVAVRLRDAAAGDARVRVVANTSSPGNAGAVNSGVATARGDWIVFLDHDDALEPEALSLIADAARPHVDLIYTDELITRADLNSVRGVAARGAFSYDFYLSHPYFVHLVAARTELVRGVGGVDAALSASADIDLMLRLIEKARHIAHIGFPAYRWRTHPQSLGHKGWDRVMSSTRDALDRHFARAGANATAAAGPTFNTFRIDWPPADGKVLVVIPTRDRADLLATCLASLRETCAEDLDIVVIDHESVEPATFALFESFGSGIKVVRWRGAFNYAAMNNAAVRRHGGDARFVLFLNNDVEALEPGWLSRLKAMAARPDVGAVGATLLYPDGRVQHAGVALGLGDLAEHMFKFESFELDGARNPGPNCALVSSRDVSAVTGACMMMRREVFEEVGGFDEAFAVGFNDTDLCLRVGAAGYRIINDAFAVLRHHESLTRRAGGDMRHAADTARLRQRWGAAIAAGDPFLSPLLDRDPTRHGWPGLLESPRVTIRPGLGGVS